MVQWGQHSQAKPQESATNNIQIISCWRSDGQTTTMLTSKKLMHAENVDIQKKGEKQYQNDTKMRPQRYQNDTEQQYKQYKQ